MIRSARARRAFVFLLSLTLAGCRGGGPDEAAPGLSAGAVSGDQDGGLVLPPDFKPVELPKEIRKEIYEEAARARALAVLEANKVLPMDEAHLPIGDTAAFDKRVAEHKEILAGIVEKKLDALAEHRKLTREQLAHIEDEAARLRWLPPTEPTSVEDSKAP